MGVECKNSTLYFFALLALALPISWAESAKVYEIKVIYLWRGKKPLLNINYKGEFYYDE